MLSGRASELEHDLPYWIFVDALDEYVRTLDSEWVEEINRQSGGELARIFPSFAADSVVTATVLDERYRIHRAVRELLEQLADQTPLVLLLDDLHWADPASVDLVGALLRRPPQASVLVVLAHRQAQISPRLEAALERCHRAGELERVELRRLDEAEVEQLLGPDFPPVLGKRLFEESGGNPFYLEQLARATGSEPQVTPLRSTDAMDGEGSGVPRAVALALTDELATLSAPARSLLEAGAVIGDPFELEFAAAAEAVSESEALSGLDELLMIGLVRRTDAPRRFRFRHPLLRRAVYDATSAEWKSKAHARAARALAAHGQPAVVRARHVEQFALLGDREAIAVLREAADTSAARAPASAARWYRAALRLLPAEPTEERNRMLVQLADVLAGIGEFAESRDTLVALLDRIPAEDRTIRIKLVGDCARVEHLLGRRDDAHRRLLAALKQLPDNATEDATTLLLGLAMDAYYRRDYQGMRDWSARALESAEQLRDRLLEAAAHGIACLAHAYGGDRAGAERHRVEAAAVVDALSDAELAHHLDAAATLGAAELYLDRYPDAVGHLKRGLAVGRATGQGRLFPLLTQELGVTLGLLGRLTEARDHLDGSIEAARMIGDTQSLAWTLMNRAWIALVSGDLDTALQTAEESAELVSSFEESAVSTWSASILGSVLAEAGEPARGLELILDGAGGRELPLLAGDFRVIVQERVVQAWLASGNPVEARAAAARAEVAAAVNGLNLAVAMACRARAAVELAAGDTAAAAELALEAATLSEAIEARVEAARSRTLAGRALIATGKRDEAADQLEAAAAELDACGATRYRDEAERELRRLGRRHHRHRGAGRTDGQDVGTLTPRELEVARLVQERKTNREIAASLFLSEKTVETHLRHIFGKLGVSSRASVARALESESS